MKAAGALLAVTGLAVGIWAGTHFHSSRSAASGAPAASSASSMQVPVGEASPPDPLDLQANLDQVPHAALKIPVRLPDFSLTDRSGRLTPVATWSGKSLVLNFWATWCAPCRREIPLLKSLSVAWGQRGVQVVGIAVDYRDKVAAYADQLAIPYPILVGEEDALDVAAKFGVDSPVFPFTVFTDRRGQVVTLYVGELHQAQADLILAAVQNVNDGRIELAEARRAIAAGLHALTADSRG